ncbi:ABC transporter permease [Neobacillus sp. PS3-34]|uniref:ABC transporter permease n=1 Tax=Neobacillus sp. PS3-34 TaxID=3070678 RepID=UPI0027DF64F7|nr:ABC transporter permease [Neobacillus sp. PS3-34]WML48453.1 ABC transporter permease [Neobacillus sp. PS3-34]
MKLKYFAKKLSNAIVTLFFVLVINYFLFRVMPGNPLAMMLRDPKASPESVEKMKHLFGLDHPWYVQFGLYVKALLKGDLGMSFLFKQPVVDLIATKIVPTLLLVGVATLVSLLGGIFLGILAARKRGKKVDVFSLSFSLLTYSMPTFWVGVVLVALLSVHFTLFPTSGMSTAGMVFANSMDEVLDVAHHLLLPALSLSLVLLGQYVLIMRNSLIDELTEDYVQTAKAKGFSEKYIVRKHAVPNAMLPMVTVISINLGFMIAGAIEIETVFSWPGIGRLMYEALLNRDYPLLQGIFLIISICVILANLIADVLYGYLDPRVKG